MQFYDGHVYLLFTSYDDDVTITVPDLYAGHDISEQYYTDIQNNIANGSNHSNPPGSDPEAEAGKYFTLNKDMTSVTLDRGEIVTIGMYCDFDLTAPEAAMGSIMNKYNRSINSGLSRKRQTIASIRNNRQNLLRRRRRKALAQPRNRNDQRNPFPEITPACGHSAVSPDNEKSPPDLNDSAGFVGCIAVGGTCPILSAS